MNKTQKSILTVEIIVIGLGLLILAYGLLNSGGGSRKQYITKVRSLKTKLDNKKKKYINNEKIIALYSKEESKLDNIIKKYEDKKYKFNKDIESRKYLNLENDVTCFIDDCDHIKQAISKTQDFIRSVNKYFNDNISTIKTVKSSKKVKSSTRKKISNLERSLKDGLANLQALISKVQTPDDATNLSLKQLELEQPFAEFRNNVKIAYEINQETQVIPNTKPIKIVITTPRVVKIRKIKKTKNAELISPFNPHSYPDKFKGTNLCVIKIKINKEGTVVSANVSQPSGNTDFDNFCKNAAKSLKYKPAMGYYMDDPSKKEFPIVTVSQYPFKAPSK